MSLISLVVLFVVACIALFMWQIASGQRSLFEVRTPFGGLIPSGYRLLYILGVVLCVCAAKYFGVI